jgi:putative hydrolase of the HAD superfamily
MRSIGEGNGSGARGPVQAVFFDAGFTLVFPVRPVIDLYVEAARAVSSGHCDDKLRETFKRAWSSGTRDQADDHRSSDELERQRWHRFTLKIAREIPELLPHHDAWLDALRGRFDSDEGWKLVPEAPGVLRALRSRGIKVAIVSNWHAGLQRTVTAVGLDDLVDDVVCSAVVGFRKPHPEIFNIALRRAGVSASTVLHVGDTWEEDVVGAVAAGITPVHLTNGEPPQPDRGHHHVIRGLSEITDLV